MTPRRLSALMLTAAIGSDDASPTAPSGSAQLNHQSEAETPAWALRNGIWNKQDSMTHARAGSGSASPNTTRDGSLAQHGIPNSQFFARQALGQNGTPTFSSRTKSNGALEKYPPVFGTMSDDVENSSPYPPMPSKYTLDSATFKRGSQDQGFPALGHIRDNGSISTSRPTDFSVQTTPGSLNPDLSQFPFDSAMSANPRGSLSRPVPNHSISFPANGNSHRGLSVSLGVDRELPGLLAETLRLNDGMESDAAGLPTNGYLNPASQPFQFNPSSQNWSGDLPSNGRGFGQAAFAQHDSYADQASNPYPDLKRGSIDRGSPSTANFHRPGLASPRYTPGPGRGDSWPGSRPISRNHALAQEFERQQQFSQNPSFYPNGQYYGNNFSSQYSSPVQPYEIYSQNPGFRNQVQLPSYGMVNGYMLPLNAPVRPSRDQDPGKGVRSVLLEEFRGSNRSNKRFELRVCTLVFSGWIAMTNYFYRISMDMLLSSAVTSTDPASFRRSSRQPTAMRRTRFSKR
jgi:mRNA-binding protein PUF3